jgi:glycosyltransferase involved in cell wall biosynthesis
VTPPRSVVQVTLWDSPYLGNFMTSALALAERTRELFGLGTHFVLAPGGAGAPWLEDLERAGVSWSILPPTPRDWKAHLAQVLREHDTALLHTHFTAADLQGAAAAAAAGVPCVWHIHTGFSGYSLRQRAKDLFKMRYVARRRVARLIVVSPWLEQLLRRRGVPAEKVAVVPNPIAVERLADLPGRAEARARFELDPDAQVALCLGWWPQVKGVDVFLDALELLLARREGVQALLVGEGQTRALLAERYPQQPPWLRVTSFVRDVAWLYAAADVLVSASRHEGQSMAIGEALVCGLGVVMSDIEGTAGWQAAPRLATFPSEDVPALAAALEQALAEPPAQRRAAGERNSAWARESFGVEAWCERICEIYREVL